MTGPSAPSNTRWTFVPMIYTLRNSKPGRCVGRAARAKPSRSSARCSRGWPSNWRCSTKVARRTVSAMGSRRSLMVALTLGVTLTAMLFAGCAPAPVSNSPTATAQGACVAIPHQQSATSAGACPPAILVFSKTAEFRHDSIPAAQAALRQLAGEHGWRADFTEDSAEFTYERLARYDAVIFLLTTGDVLDAAQQAAFERYSRAGGGFVGVHSASDTEYSWVWYDGLIGAHNNQQNKHSGVISATIQVVDHAHPSTAALPDRWTR